MSYVNSGGHLTFTSSTIVSKSPFGCNTVMSFMVTIVLIPGPLFLHGRSSRCLGRWQIKV